MLQDKAFIEQFEGLTLDSTHFNHVGHMRVTWLYLQSNLNSVAADKVASGIKKYACSLGATEKFHETITRALVSIIAQRCMQNSQADWTDFLSNNIDLVDNARLVIGEYYSDELINTQAAKKRFVKPDKRALP